MKRFELIFERSIDRILKGNLESKLRRSSWIILLVLALCAFALVQAADIALEIPRGNPPIMSKVPVWKILLGR